MTHTPDSAFLVLDAPYDAKDGRVVISEHGVIQPRSDASDGWVSIPLRVTHSAGSVNLEVGPYELDARDVAKLRDAIAAYDRALHGPTIRRIK
jgi:hypothetical protein